MAPVLGPISRFMAQDHARLDALLRRTVAGHVGTDIGREDQSPRITQIFSAA